MHFNDYLEDNFSIKDELKENQETEMKTELDFEEMELNVEFISKQELLKFRHMEAVFDIHDFELKDLKFEDEVQLPNDFEGFQCQKISIEDSFSNEFEKFLSQNGAEVSHKEGNSSNKTSLSNGSFQPPKHSNNHFGINKEKPVMLDIEKMELNIEFTPKEELAKFKQEIIEAVDDIRGSELKDLALKVEDDIFDFEGFPCQELPNEAFSNDFEGDLSQDGLSYKQVYSLNEKSSRIEPFQSPKSFEDIKIRNKVATSQLQCGMVKKIKETNNKNDSSKAIVFKCFLCDYKCKTKSCLRLHMRKHSDAKQFHCPLCDFLSSYDGNIKRHLENGVCLSTKNNNIKTKVKPFKCKNCSYEARDRFQLNRHMLIHSDKKLFNCSRCDFETNQKPSLKDHNLYCCPNQLTIERPKLKCAHCDYQTHSKYTLVGHIRTHSKIKLFHCSECDFETHAPQMLRRHKLIHSNLKSYSCSECPFKSNHLRSLRTHSLIHLKSKLFKCDHCNYECSRKDVLSNHVLNMHLDYERLKCNLCDFKCRGKVTLRKHLLKHSAKLMLHKCSYCKFESNYEKVYKKHLLSHSEEEELFQCIICKYKSIDKKSVRMHILTHAES